MPLITVKAATPLIPAATYQATLVGIAPKRMVTVYSKNGEEQDFLEWTWAVAGQEITSLTTVASGPKSRINEYLVALLGAPNVKVGANFEESDLVGKTVTLQIVITEDGFSKVDRVMGAMANPAAAAAAPLAGDPIAPPAPVAAAAAPVPAAPAAPADQGLDDLPF